MRSGSDPARLQVRVEPGLGGKVTQVRLGPDGRNWLAPPLRAMRAPQPGQDWGELDCSGWDECLPNLGASPDDALADHGDVWRLPWSTESAESVESTEPVEPAGSGRWSGSVAPAHRRYRFRRDLAVAGPVLRVDYRLENLGGRPLPWAWAQHALLAADEQTTIRASAPMHLRVDSGYRDGEISDDVGWLIGDGTPSAEIGLRAAPGRAAKLWFEPPLPAVVAVLRGREWLAWQIAKPTAPGAFPDLGLWVNLGGWGDPALQQVAVEPAFGGADAPAQAYRPLTPLASGQRREWRTVIEAGVGTAALDRLLDVVPDQ